MAERPILINLTQGEDLLIKLVDAIRAKSHANHAEGIEDKEMDCWGEKLVNSEEYLGVMEKLKTMRTSTGSTVTEIDY